MDTDLMMPRRKYLISTLLLAVIGSVHVNNYAHSQDSEKAAAEQSANQFWFGFDKGDLNLIYQTMSADFRKYTAQQQFVQQVGMMRIQGGGPAQFRALVGSQSIADMPDFPGQYFYVRFKAKYPNGPVYQDAYVKKSDSQWQVWNFNVLAAPP